MTLIEVVIALGVMSIMLAGILAALMQTRRLASASVAQNCALTIVQGYVEQMKNMPLQQFVNASAADAQITPHLDSSFYLPTMKSPIPPPADTPAPNRLKTTQTTVTLTAATAAGLQTYYTALAASVATLTSATPGVTPTGVVDNLQTFDMDLVTSAATTTWAAVWPGANTTLTPYPVSDLTTYPNHETDPPRKTDLRMNFWVQIYDLTPTSSSKCKAYGFIIVYTWQYLDGGRVKYAMDSVRSIRSAVQTF